MQASGAKPYGEMNKGWAGFCRARVATAGVGLSASQVTHGVPAGNRTQIGRLGGNSFIQLNYGDTGSAWVPRRAHYNKHRLEI